MDYDRISNLHNAALAHNRISNAMQDLANILDALGRKEQARERRRIAIQHGASANEYSNEALDASQA